MGVSGRPILLVLILVLPLVPVHGAEADPDVTTLDFLGCSMHYGEIPILKPEAAQLVPQGFTPKSGLLGRGGPAAANLFVLAQRCTVETDTGLVIEDYHDILHGIYVSPPQALDTPAIDAVLTGLMTSDPQVAHVYESWGLVPDADGEVLIETAAPAGIPTTGVSRGDGPFGLVIQQNVPPVENHFRGLKFRLWVTDEARGVGAVAEYEMFPGSAWGLGEVEAAFTHGTPFTAVAAVGPGSMYTWPEGTLTQTLAPLPLPA